MKLRSLSIAALAVVAGALAFVPTSAQESEPTNECAPESQIRYVGVDGDHRDAYVLDSPDWLGDIVAPLEFKQQVELLGEEEGGYTKVRTTAEDKPVEGWVKAGILVVREGETAREKIDDVSHASKSRRSIEDELREDYPELDAHLHKVDLLETLINRRLGGHPTEPDPSVERDRIDAFTAEGGLGE